MILMLQDFCQVGPLHTVRPQVSQVQIFLHQIFHRQLTNCQIAQHLSMSLTTVLSLRGLWTLFVKDFLVVCLFVTKGEVFRWNDSQMQNITVERYILLLLDSYVCSGFSVICELVMSYYMNTVAFFHILWCFYFVRLSEVHDRKMVSWGCLCCSLYTRARTDLGTDSELPPIQCGPDQGRTTFVDRRSISPWHQLISARAASVNSWMAIIGWTASGDRLAVEC